MMIIKKVPDVTPSGAVLDSAEAYQIQRDDGYIVIGSELVHSGKDKRFIISDITKNVTREHTFIYIGNNFYPISIKPFYTYEPLQKQGTSLLCIEGIRKYHEMVFSKRPKIEFLTDEYFRTIGNVLRYKDRKVCEAFKQVLCTEPRLFKLTNGNNLPRIVRYDIEDFADELTDIYYNSGTSDELDNSFDKYVKLKDTPRAAIKRALRSFEPQIYFDLRGDLFTRPSLVTGVISQQQINKMFHLGILEKESENLVDRHMEHVCALCDVYDCNDYYTSSSIVEFLQSCPYTDIWLTFVDHDFSKDNADSSFGWILEDESYVENRYLDIIYEGSDILKANDGHWCKSLFKHIDALLDLVYEDRHEEEAPIKIEFLFHNQVAMFVCYTKNLSMVYCYDLILYNAISTSLVFGEEDNYVRS